MSSPCESFVVTELAIGTVGNMSGAAKKVNLQFHYWSTPGPMQVLNANLQGLSSIQRALERWPKDLLRPEVQLQEALARRLQSGTAADELRQARPLLALLDNQYAKKVSLPGLSDPQAGGD